MAKQSTKNQKIETLKLIARNRKSPELLTLAEACERQNITKSTFYNWSKQERLGSLEPVSRKPHSYGNEVSLEIKKSILRVHEEDPKMTYNAIFEILKSCDVNVCCNTVIKVIQEHES